MIPRHLLVPSLVWAVCVVQQWASCAHALLKCTCPLPQLDTDMLILRNLCARPLICLKMCAPQSDKFWIFCATEEQLYTAAAKVYKKRCITGVVIVVVLEGLHSCWCILHHNRLDQLLLPYLPIEDHPDEMWSVEVFTSTNQRILHCFQHVLSISDRHTHYKY